ncbi:MAG TPA: CHASE3 domain-containing protein [Caulobacteraceae bacterium]|jgi:PAS domain S-box-containing protein
MLAPALLLVFLAGLTVLLSVSHLYSVRQDRRWVLHSYKVIQATQTLFSQIQDVESGQRGYLFLRDPQFLGAYDVSLAKIPATSAELARLVADNPEQEARVARLNALVAQRASVAARRVELARQGRRSEALTGQYGQGHNAMMGVRAAVADIMRSENALLDERNRKADRTDLIGLVVGLLFSALSILGLGLMILSMVRANQRLEHEIGERETAEAARREGEALYRAIFDNTADLICVLDVLEDGRFVMAQVNAAYEQAVGASFETLRGVDAALLVGERQREGLVAHLKKVGQADQPIFTRDRVFLPSGERIWESVMVAIRNPEGRADRILGSSRDVTEREQAQEQLRRVQRMEAVGHLTGGVAHDFNNLLQVIRGNLELISAQIGDGPGSARIKNALHAAERAAQLTRQLLAFARRQPLEPKVVNLGRLVMDMSEMLRRTLGETVDVETVLASDLWNTLADPAQVESAILNLALNARDAMAGGGRLTIEINNAVLDEGYARRDTDLEPGQYVLIAVSDTGHGMDAATQKRVFEPFFTTKSEEKGTGLGLSMVYGFVKQSHGHVQLYSELGQGTTVKIYLPRAQQDEQEPELAATGSMRGQSEVILVVEDDDLVRASAVGMLRDLGYTCIHASDGAAALAVLKSGAKVDLLFTDVIMPGPVKSRDLAREAQALRPGLPVLYTSGYTENAIVHHGRLDEGVQLLSKPYTRDSLARKIRSLLNTIRRVVLVVEDDFLVRMAAVDMIEALGFTPLQAGDAPSALAILEGAEDIDILFTDVGLPGVRGTELAIQAKAMRPDLRVIFASGYGDLGETDGLPTATHLRKPYEQDELAEALAAAVV